MRAYERLLQYVQVHTTSDPLSGTHPSTQRQFDLARMLVEELQALGVEDAAVDEHCYVYGTLPPTPGCEERPALGLIAHMDTAPDASGENVRPVLHQDYDGRDVTLPATGAVMRVKDFPFLASMKGETLITTDGSTLLGADDKAGVAEIMTAVETLQQSGAPHGKLCIAFTPDEEIGEGASLFDLERFGAAFAYTVDGGDVGGSEYENFNAASATVTVRGLSVQTGGTVTVELKDGYRNMIEKIRPHFHLVEAARAAIRAAGLEPEEVPVRGGTDGAVLSWKGLPCPNLGTGGFNFHGVLECITAERMDKATEVILNIVGLYARDPA